MRRIIISCLWVLAITNINGMEFEKADDHQKNNSMDIETSDSSSGGSKRLRGVGDFCNEVKTFNYDPFNYDPFFLLLSLHLSFEDRVTRLGATCLNFRNIIMREITELPKENLDSILENDTYLKSFPNLTSLELENNDAITDKSLSCLINLKSLSFCDSAVTDNSLKHLVNLQKLCSTSGTLITSSSLRYLTNLTSLEIDIVSDDSDIFGPVLETLPKLSTLTLATSIFLNHEDFFGLTNLTQLKIFYMEEDESMQQQVLNSHYRIRLFKHLPMLQLIEREDAYGRKFTETRDQFTKKEELRKKFLDKVKQENPCSSWKNIHKMVEDLAEEDLDRNG